jgi:hypothetical protein
MYGKPLALYELQGAAIAIGFPHPYVDPTESVFPPWACCMAEGLRLICRTSSAGLNGCNVNRKYLGQGEALPFKPYMNVAPLSESTYASLMIDTSR